MMAVVPLLLVVRVMKTAESSTSYSINNTAQQVLWLPTTTEMKYKAKPAIDSFFVRVGDGLAALTVLFGLRVYGLETRSLFAFNVVLVVLWLLLGVFVVREHHRLRALQRALAATPHDSAGGDLALSLPISEPDAP
jgi:AAA family ATP:ADP antiporter